MLKREQTMKGGDLWFLGNCQSTPSFFSLLCSFWANWAHRPAQLAAAGWTDHNLIPYRAERNWYFPLAGKWKRPTKRPVFPPSYNWGNVTRHHPLVIPLKYHMTLFISSIAQQCTFIHVLFFLSQGLFSFFHLSAFKTKAPMPSILCLFSKCWLSELISLPFKELLVISAFTIKHVS